MEYGFGMTEMLERALELARDLSDEAQDIAARYIISLAVHQTDDIRPATPAEIASMAESLAQADRGEFASDEEVEAMWAKFERPEAAS